MKGRILTIASVAAIVICFIALTTVNWGVMYSLHQDQVAILEKQNEIIASQNELINVLKTAFHENLGIGSTLQPQIEVHVFMEHWRDGVLLASSHHAGTLTNIGKDWIEDQLGDSPSTDPAKWIGLSNSSDSPSASWETIPDEITTGNMGRAAGTYANVDMGQWNITKSFSPSETNSTQLTGLYYAASGDYLLAADTITLTNYQSGDTVGITWQITASS